MQRWTKERIGILAGESTSKKTKNWKYNLLIFQIQKLSVNWVY